MSRLIPSRVNDQPLRLLVTGAPKTGKTKFAASFPNPLFVDMDENLNEQKDKVLRWLMRDPEMVMELCALTGTKPLVPTKNGSTMLNYYDAWLHFWQLLAFVGSKSPAAPPILHKDLVNAENITIVIDSLTVMVSAIEFFANSHPDGGNQYFAYKLLVNYYSGMFTALGNLRVPMVMLAHSYIDKDTKVLSTQVSGQFAQVIGAFFNHTAYAYSEMPVGGTGKPTFKILIRGIREGSVFGGCLVNAPDIINNDYKELNINK